MCGVSQCKIGKTGEVKATNDLDTLRTWIGRAESSQDTIDARPARLMQQTLDHEATLKLGDELPPMWHWLYFLSSVPLSGVGRDGHPARGGFLPPVALPRRMWAGGRFELHAPLTIGDQVTKTSTISDVNLKTGSSGDLCFVTVTHDYSVGDSLRFREEQDLVYRDDPKPGAPARSPKPAPTEADWTREVSPSEVQLFRYSALTFNSHRIHYDRDYCRDVEGYPGLVFHGPLTATLLAGLAASECDGQLATFSFRAMSPLFDTASFAIAGTQGGASASVWAATPDGGLAMQAEVTFQDQSG